MTTADPDRQARLALQHAWTSATGTRPTPPIAAAMLTRGWTPDVVADVLRLERHAEAVHATISVVASTSLTRMLSVLDVATKNGAAMPHARAWLAVIASETNFDRYGALFWGMTWACPGDEDWTEGAVPIRDWSERVGPLAPLAWAAGLDLTEAEAQRAVGTLREPALRTLVALRGYRLPEVTPCQQELDKRYRTSEALFMRPPATTSITPTVQVTRRLNSIHAAHGKFVETTHLVTDATEDDLFVDTACGLTVTKVAKATRTSVLVFRTVNRDVTCKRCLRTKTAASPTTPAPVTPATTETPTH